MNLPRVLRFAGVGVVNTGVYYCLYLIFQMFWPYLVAHVCAFTLAMIGSYFLNCFVTFHRRPTWRTFALFPLSNLANFVITTVGLRLLVGTLGVDERIAPIPVALIAIPITYVVAHTVMLGRLSQPTPQEKAPSDARS
ncbi:MAG: GtrA family protein [Nocardioidaceae bacterium]